MFFSHPQKWSEFWHFEKLWILALVCTHMEIFGFEVLHEYIIEYMEAVEPFSCSYCEKKLVLKDDLREYERIHSGEKSFSLLREEIRPEGRPERAWKDPLWRKAIQLIARGNSSWRTTWFNSPSPGVNLRALPITSKDLMSPKCGLWIVQWLPCFEKSMPWFPCGGKSMLWFSCGLRRVHWFPCHGMLCCDFHAVPTICCPCMVRWFPCQVLHAKD